MSCRVAVALLFVLSLGAFSVPQNSDAATLVGNAFPGAYQNWTDPATARGGNWRVSLHNPTMMETSNLIPAGNNPAAATNNGSIVPSLLIQDGFTTPSTYDLSARLYSSDDDGFGLVFGYQDINNYFRVTSRAQANGNLGGTNGLSVQKVVAGVSTQLHPVGNVAGFNVDNSFALIDSRSPYDLTVSVSGTSYSVSMAGANGGNPIWSGSDNSLAAGKVGVHSWAQRNRVTNSLNWGTELESISVSDSSSVLYNGTFNSLPVKWRPLAMANSNGVRTSNTPGTNGIAGDDRGNFGADINNPWILQQTNGYEWATQVAPNVDFIGPAVVVDEPGSASYSDYQMQVRLGAVDDDGIGVIVRAQDDDNFYRIHFATQSIAATNNWERAPRGLSVQKVRNGVWSELYRDNQDTPLFVYANGPANPVDTQSPYEPGHRFAYVRSDRPSRRQHAGHSGR